MLPSGFGYLTNPQFWERPGHSTQHHTPGPRPHRVARECHGSMYPTVGQFKKDVTSEDWAESWSAKATKPTEDRGAWYRVYFSSSPLSSKKSISPVIGQALKENPTGKQHRLCLSFCSISPVCSVILVNSFVQTETFLKSIEFSPRTRTPQSSGLCVGGESTLEWNFLINGHGVKMKERPLAIYLQQTLTVVVPGCWGSRRTWSIASVLMDQYLIREHFR